MYHFIINPVSRSGKGQKIWSELKTYLIQHKIPYKAHISDSPGKIIEIVRELTENSQNNSVKLVVLGGDGTMNEVLQGVKDFSRTDIAYIPTGSSNDLARDLKIRGSPLEILKDILNTKEPVLIDLGELTYNSIYKDCETSPNHEKKHTRYFAVSSGIGYDASICKEAMTSKAKKVLNKLHLGKLTYGAIAIKQLFTSKKPSCELLLDNTTHLQVKKLRLLSVMIHSYQGGGMKFCPDANWQDGEFDLCVAGDISIFRTLLLLPQTFSGKHVGAKGVHICHAKEVHIQTEVPLWVHTDGEVSVQSNDITLCCKKQSIRLLNPVLSGFDS